MKRYTRALKIDDAHIKEITKDWTGKKKKRVEAWETRVQLIPFSNYKNKGYYLMFNDFHDLTRAEIPSSCRPAEIPVLETVDVSVSFPVVKALVCPNGEDYVSPDELEKLW